MNRYRTLFSRLAAAREGGFIPFVTLGDPDRSASADLLACLIESGADALELGLPFSDPVADGPVIQAASTRALRAGVTMDDCLALVAEARARAPDLPIGLLGYANPILHRGLDRFYRDVARAGADSVLTADVPLDESEPFRAAALSHEVAQVLIVPPNADPERIDRVARASRGYIYVTTRSGVTGDHGAADPALVATLTALRASHAPPPVLGFGIASADQVRAGIAIGAAGVIAGSAVIRRIEQNLGDRGRMMTEVARVVRSMKAATRSSDPLGASLLAEVPAPS